MQILKEDHKDTITFFHTEVFYETFMEFDMEEEKNIFLLYCIWQNGRDHTIQR